MQRVNILLRLGMLTLLFLNFYGFSAQARNYVPARRIGVKNNNQYRKAYSPPKTRRMPQQVSRNRYAPSRKASAHFRKTLAGPYVGVGIGVQMHRHNGDSKDNTPQVHQFDTNDQGFGMDVVLGWMFVFQRCYLAGLEIGLQPIPLKTSMTISDGSTFTKIRGQLAFQLAALLGRQFLEGSAIAYIKLALEWRKFCVKHEVDDGAVDDIDDGAVFFGWSPGVGLGFWIYSNLYLVGEYHTTFYRSTTFTSPAGRLTLENERPRVDMFLLKLIMPLNQCFGTRFGFW